MDCITLKNLKYRGFHGYHPAEREDGNDFEVDVVFWVPMNTAAQSDDLNQTIDYSQVAGMVADIMQGPSVKLLETLLYSIGTTLSHAYPEATKIEVAVRKLHPPMTSSCDYTEVRSQWPGL